jgi:hypothetical protein
MAKDSFTSKEMLIRVMDKLEEVVKKQDETILHVKETNGKVALATRDIENNRLRITKLENDITGVGKRTTKLENFNIKLAAIFTVVGVIATYLVQFAFKHFFG